MLREEDRFNSRYSQSFVLPSGANFLQFTIVDAHLVGDEKSPPDAFEVALLDYHTGNPLATVAEGLTRTDALLNIQRTGEVYFGSDAVVPGVDVSGTPGDFLDYPCVVTVDLRGVTAGTEFVLSSSICSDSAASRVGSRSTISALSRRPM